MHDPAAQFRAAILAALPDARPPEVIEPGRFHRYPTSNRRGDDAGWAKLYPDMRGGVFGCYRQGVSEHWRASDGERLNRRQRIALAAQAAAAAAEREAQQRQQWHENAQRIAAMWSECVPLVPGDPVTLYLKARGFASVWPLPSVLRLHRALPYWDGPEHLGDFPAMVAPLVGPDGRIVALHRTYLARDGRKAAVPTPRKLTAASGPVAGACIPLHKPSGGVLGIAEGIETALAAWCASTVPTVAAYSAGNLAAWQWPVAASRLVIFADADKAGRQAAEGLQKRARASGVPCRVLMPETEGADWCDVWVKSAQAVAHVAGEANQWK